MEFFEKKSKFWKKKSKFSFENFREKKMNPKLKKNIFKKIICYLFRQTEVHIATVTAKVSESFLKVKSLFGHLQIFTFCKSQNL